MVSDRYAMAVSPQIVDDMLTPTEGLLGIHDPVFGVKAVFPVLVGDVTQHLG